MRLIRALAFIVLATVTIGGVAWVLGGAHAANRRASGETKAIVSSALKRSDGVIAGTLGINGGSLRPGTGPLPEAGTIQLAGNGRAPITIRVGTSGTFRAHVPAGRYRVAAGLNYPYDWPVGSCDNVDLELGRQRQRSDDPTDQVDIEAGAVLNIDVLCLAF